MPDVEVAVEGDFVIIRVQKVGEPAASRQDAKSSQRQCQLLATASPQRPGAPPCRAFSHKKLNAEVRETGQRKHVLKID